MLPCRRRRGAGAGRPSQLEHFPAAPSLRPAGIQWGNSQAATSSVTPAAPGDSAASITARLTEAGCQRCRPAGTAVLKFPGSVPGVPCHVSWTFRSLSKQAAVSLELTSVAINLGHFICLESQGYSGAPNQLTSSMHCD
jgi:hypothetical protein